MEADIEKRLKRFGYQKIEYLGAGTYGKTYLIQKIDSGRSYVVKIMPRDLSIRKNRHEIKLLQSFKSQHPNLVQIVTWHEDDLFLYLVMEYIENSQDLSEFMETETASIECIRTTMLQLIDALKYLHRRKIAHQDIKLSNILIDGDCRPILIDYGLSCLVGQGRPSETILFDRSEYAKSFGVSEKEFDKMIDKVSQIIQINHLDDRLNCYTHLVKESCRNTSLSVEQLKSGVILLVQLTSELDIILNYDPIRRSRMVTDYLTNHQIPLDFRDAIGRVDRTIFDSETLYKKLNFYMYSSINQIYQIGECSPPQAVGWTGQIKTKELIPLYAVFEILLKNFTIDPNVPIEIYLRAVDLMTMIVMNDDTIPGEGLFILGAACHYLAETKFLEDLGPGINCLELNVGTEFFAPPEVEDPDRDPLKGDIHALGVTLDWWIHRASKSAKGASELFQPIIDRMTDKDPNQRPSLDQLTEWFTNVGLPKIESLQISVPLYLESPKIDLVRMKNDSIDYDVLMISYGHGQGYKLIRLKEITEQLGLKKSGNKLDLIERIVEHYTLK